MQQHEFIWLGNNMKVGRVGQDTVGNTIVDLRPQIQITHNYKKKNLMLITFSDDGLTFIIPSKSQLEDIYRMHLSNVHLGEILRKYCEDNLQKA